MPALGWLIGSGVGPMLRAWEHWVAFVLLSAIGAKMLWDARKGPDGGLPSDDEPFAIRVLLLLGVATSIDAFAAGISLPMLGLELWPSVVVIGVVTAALSLIGLILGYRFRLLLGRSLDVLGGLVLVGLGTKVLVMGLS